MSALTAPGDYGRSLIFTGWGLEFAESITPHFSIAGHVSGFYRSVDYSPGFSDSYRLLLFAMRRGDLRSNPVAGSM
jgi:hypothetical protein